MLYKWFHKIPKPYSKQAGENCFDFNSDQMCNRYDELDKKRFSITKLVYVLMIRLDANLYIILAGVFASVPVNILTSFPPLRSMSGSACLLFFHIFQLLFSIICYVAFFLFMWEAQKMNHFVCAFKPRARNELEVVVEQARENIKFAYCMKSEKSLRRMTAIFAIFAVLTIVSFFFEP